IAQRLQARIKKPGIAGLLFWGCGAASAPAKALAARLGRFVRSALDARGPEPAFSPALPCAAGPRAGAALRACRPIRWHALALEHAAFERQALRCGGNGCPCPP